MVSRRDFLTTSLAVSAGSALGPNTAGGDAVTPQPAAAKAVLTIFFVGGTLFRRSEDQKSMLAIQMSGKDQDGNDVLDFDEKPMLHRSFLVVPASSPLTGKPFPDRYPMHKLHARLEPAEDFKALCLEHRDVSVTPSDSVALTNNCQQTAKYSARLGDPIGDWHQPRAGLNKAISSRFTLNGGVLKDGGAVNHTGAGSTWKVYNGAAKGLSDVALYRVKAGSIALKITGERDYTLQNGEALTICAFAGPTHFHLGEQDYEYISHALLLHTLYTIPGKRKEVCPKSTKKLKTTKVDLNMTHPCAFQEGSFWRAPPDSEYCVNYEECNPPCP